MKRKPSPDTPQKKSWRVLAGELQTTDRSLRLWRQRPGAPTGPDVDAWRRFMAAEGLGRSHTNELADLRRQVEGERLRKLKRENAQAEGRLIPMGTLAAALSAKSFAFARILRFELEQNLPALLVGQPIGDIRRELRDACDRVTDKYNQAFIAAELASDATGGTE